MIRQIGSRTRLGWVLGVLAAGLCCVQLGTANEAQQEKAGESDGERQRINMQRSAAQYSLYSMSAGEATKRVFKFQENNALRSSNPVTGTTDGGLYVWTDHGRPQAVVKFFTFNNKTYTHAWLSLSETTFMAERNGRVVWSPNEPGIKWSELPDAPKPAETAAERLRQMRNLAGKFSATYTATHLGTKPFELRLLTQPLFRYETDDDYRADGALFGYVQSTAPVGLLLLESRQSADGPRWHYAFASLVTGPVTARYGEEKVFFLERDNKGGEPRQQTHVLFHSVPEPKE